VIGGQNGNDSEALDFAAAIDENVLVAVLVVDGAFSSAVVVDVALAESDNAEHQPLVTVDDDDGNDLAAAQPPPFLERPPLADDLEQTFDDSVTVDEEGRKKERHGPGGRHSFPVFVALGFAAGNKLELPPVGARDDAGEVNFAVVLPLNGVEDREKGWNDDG
jgi:hypothetical protein